MLSKKKESYVYIYFLLLPLVDLITSLSLRITNSSITLGEIIKGLTLVFCILYIFFISKSKHKKLSILYYLLLIIYGVLYVFSKRNILSFTFFKSELSYALRYFYFPIVFVGIINIFDDFDFSKDRIYKVLIINSVVYSLLIVVPYILGIGYNSYIDYVNFKGNVGLFYSANELSCILTMLSICLFYYLNKNIKLLILIVPVLFSLSVIGTKVGMLGMIITSFFCVLSFIIKKKKQAISLSVLMLIIVAFFVFLSPASNNLKSVEENYSNNNELGLEEIKTDNSSTEVCEEKKEDNNINDDRYTCLYNIIKNQKLSSIITIMFNGRDQQFLKNFNVYSRSKMSNKFFGLGWNDIPELGYTSNKLIEIDYLDIWIHYGIVGFLVYFIPLISIIIVSIKNIRNFNLESFTVLSIIVTSFGIAMMAGHLFSAPAVAIYLIILIMYYVYTLKEDNVKK